MKMGSTNPFQDKSLSLTKRLLPSTLYAMLPISLLYIYFHSLSFTPSPETELPHSSPITITYHSSLSASPPPPPPSSSATTTTTFSAEKDKAYENSCDYSNGEWVRDTRGPLYSGTTCSTINQSEKCIPNGRPDSGYLYWRWKPIQCHLPRFEPYTFLQLIRNRHIAFVGDSLARNQLESLLCMLATASTPKLVHHKGSRRWHFLSHNANFSFYWSPFLVQGVQRSNEGPHYNTMYLDHVNKKWARDMDQMDLIVLSFGQGHV